MPQLPRALAKERAARLRAAGEARHAARLDAMLGRTEEILMESPRRGRTRCFTPVELVSDAKPTSLVMAHLATRRGARLAGHAAT
jgi:threonylcarbamoyladenosine tRNA methylthiotransferase MtaB